MSSNSRSWKPRTSESDIAIPYSVPPYFVKDRPAFDRTRSLHLTARKDWLKHHTDRKSCLKIHGMQRPIQIRALFDAAV